MPYESGGWAGPNKAAKDDNIMEAEWTNLKESDETGAFNIGFFLGAFVTFALCAVLFILFHLKFYWV